MKLFLAILLSIGIAFGGCATNPGNSIESTIPNMEYDDIDVFKDGNITKVPKYIDAPASKWYSYYTKLTNTIKVGNYTNKYKLDEKITLICDIVNSKVLLLVYGNGEEVLDFYIYNGKQFPTKTTEDAAKAYMKLITKQVINTGK
jgi:hypothetical protein